MIDGIKVCNLITTNDFDLLKHELLKDNWITKTQNGEILYEEATYKNLRFSNIKFRYGNNYHKRLIGSIHKYFNNGLTNYNDFSFREVIYTVNEIVEKFHLCDTNMINNIEFGVNLKLPFDCNIILDNLITHKGVKFSFEKESDKSYYQCVRPQFIIKIYDKGLQNRLPENILRFEIKVRKMQYLHKKGIHISTFSTLKEHINYVLMKELLLSTFDEILINCEPINIEKLTQKDREKYLKAINPNTWCKESNKKNKSAAERKKLERLLIDYNRIVATNISSISIKEIVKTAMETKLNELIDNHYPEINVTNLPLEYRVNMRHNRSLNYQTPQNLN